MSDMEKPFERELSARDLSSVTRATVSGVVAAFVATIFLLLGIYVIDSFNAAAQTGLEYWTEKILTSVATFTLMLSTANICEESRKRRDTSYADRVNSIDSHYQTILGGGRVDELEEFILNINIASKYKEFLRSTKKRIRVAVLFRRDDKRKRLEELMLMSPEELWEDPRRVKFHRVTYSQLFEGAQDISQNDDDNDLNVHRMRFTLQKLAWKIITLVAFGAVATDIAFSFVGFTSDMVLTLIIKIATLLIAVYSGVSFGFSMVERTKIVLRRKLRILSQFKARFESSEEATRFAVAIPKDIYVEKLRNARAARQLDTSPTTETTLPIVIKKRDGGFAVTLSE